MTSVRGFAVIVGTLLLALGPAVPASAQVAPEAIWNDPRALELLRTGVDRRMTEVVDTALHSYAAEARGYVYFLLDAPELERQTLVRTDQVAVQVYWRAPNEVRQRIIGMRQQQELPVSRLYYYLDRLTVVQDNYSQGIVIADGDNVNDVRHPVSVGAEEFYDYRAVDSLTLRLPGVSEPVRVHELQVRPKNPDVPAIVGSVFLEEATGALVRMSFTFTPSAYVDPRLDYINVTLENGLWQGRYWLPHEQRLEIRRELPELDLPFGTVIRTRMRIGEYRFNEPVPEWLFTSRLPVTMAPRDEREAFPFEAPIDADWRLEGISEPLEVAEIRREAQMMMREQALSGLSSRRFGAGSASDVFRYNRADGLMLGFGVGAQVTPAIRTRFQGGWNFGAKQPVLAARVTGESSPRLNLEAYFKQTRDVGGTAPGAGLTSSLAALVLDEHWLDPYYASGLTGSISTTTASGQEIGLTVRTERQQSALLTSRFTFIDSGGPTPIVQPIDLGNHASMTGSIRRSTLAVAGGWQAEIRATAGRLDGHERDLDFAKLEALGGMTWTRPARRLSVELTGTAGMGFGTLPLQELTLLGGRGTLPGYAHRAFGGDRHATMRVTAGADLAHPWARLRLSAGAGAIGVGDAGQTALTRWGASTSGGILPFVGAGLGIFYDIVHVDFARGLGDKGQTQVIVEVQPSFWGWL